MILAAKLSGYIDTIRQVQGVIQENKTLRQDVEDKEQEVHNLKGSISQQREHIKRLEDDLTAFGVDIDYSYRDPTLEAIGISDG